MTDEPVLQPVYRIRVHVDGHEFVADCVRIMRDGDPAHDLVMGNPGSINAVIVPLASGCVSTELIQEVQEPPRAKKR